VRVREEERGEVRDVGSRSPDGPGTGRWKGRVGMRRRRRRRRGGCILISGQRG
jgi:hypothetical protein